MPPKYLPSWISVVRKRLQLFLSRYGKFFASITEARITVRVDDAEFTLIPMVLPYYRREVLHESLAFPFYDVRYFGCCNLGENADLYKKIFDMIGNNPGWDYHFLFFLAAVAYTGMDPGELWMNLHNVEFSQMDFGSVKGVMSCNITTLRRPTFFSNFIHARFFNMTKYLGEYEMFDLLEACFQSYRGPVGDIVSYTKANQYLIVGKVDPALIFITGLIEITNAVDLPVEDLLSIALSYKWDRDNSIHIRKLCFVYYCYGMIKDHFDDLDRFPQSASKELRHEMNRMLDNLRFFEEAGLDWIINRMFHESKYISTELLNARSYIIPQYSKHMHNSMLAKAFVNCVEGRHALHGIQK